eukprot:jgi/Picre1/35583/NNA_003044.t1
MNASARVGGQRVAPSVAKVPTTGINHRFSTFYGNRNVIYMNNVAIRKSIVAQMTAEARDVSTPETVDAALPKERGEFAHDLTREQEAAVKAVRLASHLCDHVQSQLKDAEKVEKDDSSPVTVADYGAQALTSWSLLRSLPDLEFKMIAEEDSDDLKTPEGAAMLRRITDLVNHTLSECEEDAPLLTPDDVID